MRIWVDCSDIVNWPHRHLTGIQRVVVHVGLAFLELHARDPYAEVMFFSYKPDARKFFVVEGETVKHALDCDMKSIRVSATEADFQAGDRVYLLGGTWVHPNFVVDLHARKKSVPFKVIQFIHDVTPIKVPHTHHDKSKEIMETWFRQLEPLVDFYLTNSRFSEKEITGTFQEMGFPHKDFKVVRLGDKLPGDGMLRKPEKFGHLAPAFVLCVGSIEPRKNHFLLYQAWKLLLEKYGERTPQLALVGRAGWLSEDFRSILFRDPALKDKLVWFPHAADEELAWLYRNCRFTVYPSFYEGWGLPVAESLAYGKNCIASNAASIPEIAGERIDYFHPFDSRDCAEKVERCFFDDGYLAAKEREIRESFRITSWTETAKQCLDLDFGNQGS